MSDAMKPGFLFIGAGDLSISLLRTARELGFRVLATDRNPKAAGFAEADESFVVDGHDSDSILKWLKESGRATGLRGAYTESELHLSVARVGNAFGFPAVPVEAAQACQNKSLMKEPWLRDGVPTPRSFTVNTLEEAHARAREFSSVVLKPVEGHSSLGVGRVMDDAMFDRLYERARQVSPGGWVLVEERVLGTMHDVNGVLYAGRLHHFGIMDRHFLPPPFCVQDRVHYPSCLSEDQQGRVYRQVEEGARSLGLQRGPVKADVVWTKQGPVLLEMAPRFHGALGTEIMIPAVSGVRAMRAYLRSLLEGPGALESSKQKITRHGIVGSLLPDPGTIAAVDGIEEARRIPGVEHVYVRARPGSRIQGYESHFDVPGFVVVTGCDAREAEERLTSARNTIRFTIRAPGE